MVRICPTCNSRLFDDEYFFCTSCGTQLPETMVLKNRNFRHVFDFSPEVQKKGVKASHFGEVALRVGHILNLQVVLLLLVILGAFSVIGSVLFTKYGLGAILFPDTQRVPLQRKITPQNLGKNSLNLDTTFQSHVFGADRIWDYIPYDADIFIEAHDLRAFTDIFSVMKPKYVPLVLEMQREYTSHFALYAKFSPDQKDPSWSFVAFHDNTIDTAETSESSSSGKLGHSIDLSAYSNLSSRRFDEAEVVTTNKAELDRISDLTKGNAKGISLNPTFVAAKNTMSKSGQVFIIALTKNGRDYLYKLPAEYLLPGDILKIVEKINKARMDYAIIL